jgi:hypothetical protein
MLPCCLGPGGGTGQRPLLLQPYYGTEPSVCFAGRELCHLHSLARVAFLLVKRALHPPEFCGPTAVEKAVRLMITSKLVVMRQQATDWCEEA